MKLLIVTLLSLSATAFAQDATPESKWAHESELSAVIVDGNSNTESYAAKHSSTYTWDLNKLLGYGKYLETKTMAFGAPTQVTAKSWEAGARYERALSELWSAFVAHSAESNEFSGFVQKDNTDIGAKYFIWKLEESTWFAELGYRYTTVLLTTPNADGKRKVNENFARLFSEYTKAWEKNLSFKFWVEYLPNLDHSDAYLANAEPSLNVVLSETFSLKTGYLMKYQNVPPAGGKRLDTTFTTALIAKF